MSSEALVSIMMPVKNASPYLQACLESILAQEHKHWELLAVNDHSTDDSNDLLLAFAKKDQRIKIFQNEGEGIIPALQLAFKNAKGNFLTRMDADDLMAPNKLNLMLEVLKSNGPGHVCIGLVKYFADTKLGQGYINYEEWLNHLSREENNWAEIYKECVIPSPCWMLHRSDFEQAGAFDSEWYPEDYDLCFRFRRAGLQIRSVKEVLHFWRDHSARFSRNDPNYVDHTFIDLKIHHFAQQDHQVEKQLYVWGAGKKGKRIASLLQKQGIEFHWFSNNPKKIGHRIHGVLIESDAQLDAAKANQLIIAIANQEEQQTIKHRMFGQKAQCFWFC